MISEQLVKQVTGQEDNNRVYKLDLSVRGIVAISNLKAFQKLRCIVLDFNRISVIENLSSLTDLRQLHLQGNQIKKIAGLDNNKALNFLNLSNNKIQKIENIAHLMKLQSLYLDHNKISKLVGLQYLKQLRILSVKSNKLSAIDSMPAFSKLQNLDLSENSIQKISVSLLASSTKLTNLNLAKNSIVDISFLTPLTKVQNLDLSHNQIENLTIKTPLKNLEHLNVSYNSIYQLPSFFALFPQLTSINLSNNYIGSQMELLQALANSELITDVDFSENPMCSQNFEQTLFNLYQFDRINGKIRQKAGAKYYGQIQSIKKQFRENPDIYEQDDQEDHKIKMSGFYSEDLQLQFTGVKPNRPLSPTARRVKNSTESGSINQIDKIYKEFIENNTKIDSLRSQYLMILQKNNVTIPKVQSVVDNNESRLTTEEQSVDMRITEIKEQKAEKDSFKKYRSIERDLKQDTEGNKNKWEQLKKKQKLFNIREFSRKKSAREPSNSKLSNKNQLFKTQVNTKWNAQVPLLKTLTRAASGKKENSRIL